MTGKMQLTIKPPTQTASARKLLPSYILKTQSKLLMGTF